MWFILVICVIVFLCVAIILRVCGYLSLYGKNDVQRFDVVLNLFQNTDRLFRVRIGPVKTLGTSHPDVIQQILNHPDCIERPFVYRFTGLESGIFSAKHQLWKCQRKALNPTFNLRILHSFIPIFETCCQKMLDELSTLEDRSTVNIFSYTSKCTLGMVFGTTIGMDVLERDDMEDVLRDIERLFYLVAKRMISVHLYIDWIYRLTQDYREDRRLRKICMDKADEIINEQKQRILNNRDIYNKEDEHVSGGSFKKPQIFIEQLLAESVTGKSFNDEEIYHNAYTIIVAGNDTSGLSVAHACLFLAMYPDVQNKVHEEIMHILPSEHSTIDADSLKRLEYLDMFILETLRLCPVAPNIAREATQDVWIDDQRVTKGTIFMISFYALHRRMEFWGPTANRFDPANFNPDRVRQRHPYAFLPFSGGPRNCIGWRYATISMKVMLIYLLRNFKLSTKIQQSELRYKFDLTLKLAFDHLVQLERRELVK